MTDLDTTLLTASRQLSNAYIDPAPCTRTFRYRVIKRLLDVVLSLLLAVLLLPLCVITAIVIKLTSEGPVLYWYPLVGFGGNSFLGCKFRSMVKDADKRKSELAALNEMSGPVFKMKEDPRITRVGRFIRKYSIDELPQIWLVIKGTLSLVGPRAPGPHEFENFEPWQWRKVSVKPGLTCLWQVNGRNEIRDFVQWVKLDLAYIDDWSLWLDIQLLWKTVSVVLRGTGF